MLTQRLRAIVVDDEELALKRSVRLLELEECEIVAQFGSGYDLLKWAETHSMEDIDFLVLDVQMPGLNGIEILAELVSPPPAIFITAYSEYAIKAFEECAVDYILKPVTRDRLKKTLDRIRNKQILPISATALRNAINKNRYPVKGEDNETIIKHLEETTHFSSEDHKVFAWIVGQSHKTKWTSLDEVEKVFPNMMHRIHRHLLLRKEAVLSTRQQLGGKMEVKVIGDIWLEVSRGAKPELCEALQL